MKYLVVFGIFAACSAATAIAAMRMLGHGIAVLLGVLLSGATVALFVLNKSDSVADTFIEKLADLLPPLLTGSIVIGWWVGYALYRVVARVLR